MFMHTSKRPRISPPTPPADPVQFIREIIRNSSDATQKNILDVLYSFTSFSNFPVKDYFKQLVGHSKIFEFKSDTPEIQSAFYSSVCQKNLLTLTEYPTDTFEQVMQGIVFCFARNVDSPRNIGILSAYIAIFFYSPFSIEFLHRHCEQLRQLTLTSVNSHVEEWMEIDYFRTTFEELQKIYNGLIQARINKVNEILESTSSRPVKSLVIEYMDPPIETPTFRF